MLIEATLISSGRHDGNSLLDPEDLKAIGEISDKLIQAGIVKSTRQGGTELGTVLYHAEQLQKNQDPKLIEHDLKGLAGFLVYKLKKTK